MYSHHIKNTAWYAEMLSNINLILPPVFLIEKFQNCNLKSNNKLLHIDVFLVSILGFRE